MTPTHILLALEFFMLMLFCVPLPVINAGNTLGISFSAAVIGFTVWFYALPFWLQTSGIVVLSAVLIFAAALSENMLVKANNSPPCDKPCTVIILGCRVRGTRPTRMLRRRLDAAYDYMLKNPQAVCIVSGGKGNDERISEAAAMKKYLLDKGLSKDKIFAEDKSKSTLENLSFSKKIIEARNLPKTVATATDGFHQYRASMLAKRCDMDVYAVSARTEPRYALTYWVREWLGIVAYWFMI